MSIRAVELPPEDALRTCRFYVTNEHGYRLCGQLVEAGGQYCREHEIKSHASGANKISAPRNYTQKPMPPTR